MKTKIALVSTIVTLCILFETYAQPESLIAEGSGIVSGANILHPNGNVFDQILLTGPMIKVRPNPGNIARVSFLDTSGDIVQVEYFGAGTFRIELDPDTYLPPAFPVRYNQNVQYVTGTARVFIEGADDYTTMSIFTVGKINAANQALFIPGQWYDGKADIQLIQITNSRAIGALQMANVVFSSNRGRVGIDARGIPLALGATVGDIDAKGYAIPHLLFGEGSFSIQDSRSGVRIAGGDLYQTNGVKIISTSQVYDNLSTSDNVRSDGRPVEAMEIDAKFVFTDEVIVGESPEEDESPDKISPGSVTTTGNAVVLAKANDEQGDLQTVIMMGIGEVQIKVPLEEEVTFYSFIIIPSVSENSANPTTLNVAGAVLDFQWYPNVNNIPSGYIGVMDGNELIHTGIFFGLGPGGSAKVGKKLVLRLDSEAGVWDLYILGDLWLADLNYVVGADKIIITLGSEFNSALADIRITNSNPLFEDINKDGLPDSFEREHGYTPTTNNRQALIPGGTVSLLEYYLNTR